MLRAQYRDVHPVSVEMERFTRVVRVITVLAECMLFYSGLYAQSDNALQLRTNVVRVVSGLASNKEQGFGFIVGERDGLLYIVTTDHVVAAAPDSPASNVEVIFYKQDGSTYKAEVLRHKPDHDLALLRVKEPPNFAWYHQCLAVDPAASRGAAVVFIGRNSDWFVPATNGTIDSEKVDPDSWIDAYIPQLSPGSSGAPLVGKTGIIGMVMARSTDDARILYIDYIRHTVEYWEYPWDLQPSAQIDSSAKKADDLFVQGRILYSTAQYSEAIDRFTEALKLRANWADAYNLRGASYDKLGQLDAAFNDYDRAVKLSPDWSSPIFYRGRLSEQKGDLYTAATDYDRAIHLTPDWSSPYFSRAVIYEKQGKSQEAYEYYAKACSLSPNWQEACGSRDRLQHSKSSRH